MPEWAQAWAMAAGSEVPPSAPHTAPASARLQVAQRAINSFCRPDLAYLPKIEIFHLWNRDTLYESSDATHRADHYGMLRSHRLQRVVSRLQVKVGGAVAAGDVVCAPARRADVWQK